MKLICTALLSCFKMSLENASKSKVEVTSYKYADYGGVYSSYASALLGAQNLAVTQMLARTDKQ